MKKLILNIFIATNFILLSSCEDWLDINTDPTAATSVTGDQLFPGILANIASNRSIETGPGQMFFVQNWASNGSAGVFEQPERFIISPFTTGNTWGFLYRNCLQNLKLAIEASNELDPPAVNVIGQSTILRAMILFDITSYWGDVPFSQANNPEFAVPEFDLQQDVMRGVVDLALEGANTLDASNPFPPVTNGDFIYRGDVNKWRKFGKSLALKFLMYLYNRDESVADRIIALIEEGDLILTNADNAAIPFFEEITNANNRWKLYNQFGGFQQGFLYAGEKMVEVLKDKNDPRLGVYFKAHPDADGEILGVPAGATLTLGAEVNSDNFIYRTFPSRLLSAAELNLLIAEFYATRNELAQARTYYENGVRASFDWFDGRPGQMSAEVKQLYINSLPNIQTSGQSVALEEIRLQQYIDLFERGPEAWGNWRRTKVPALELPENATLGDIIRRWNYPPDEIAANPKTPTGIINDQPMWFEK